MKKDNDPSKCKYLSLDINSAHLEISLKSMLLTYSALIFHLYPCGERNRSRWKEELARFGSILSFCYLLCKLGDIP